ncbi:MAG: FAD-dependent oxidoreductase [Pseudomonadota bacterium]|nr:FAD-dependent oxidoreductase [Pseudomonadota bacterium]
MARYQFEPFDYVTPPELSGAGSASAPVIIVGAGPIGLAAAIDLATHGVASIVVDDNNVVSVGSRAICWAKRSLEIFDRLGVGERMLEKGVTWKLGRVYRGDREVYNFDLLPEDGHKFPAFINLQQYYVEQFLVERCADFPDLIDLRFKNRVLSVAQDATGVAAEIETPDGAYTLRGAYLLACDGANSRIRRQFGLDFEGRHFEERFLIADVEMEADFPSERWFWFTPTFHPGQSALLHKQPDNIYRIDLQLGPDADPEEEKKPENVIPRIEKVVGGRPFKLDWVSVYSFNCRRIDRFVHDRVIFVGDSAHVVSPFGARGGNGGMHDVDNLCWKLARVVTGAATSDLLESYNIERVHGADENIRNSSWTSRFMSPEPGIEMAFRNAALSLAVDAPFARRVVNAGRLSVPCQLTDSPLNGPDDGGFDVPQTVGMVALDAPLSDRDGNATWLMNQLGGRFVCLVTGDAEAPANLPEDVDLVRVGRSGFGDADGRVQERYGSAVYLVRPDQHIAARWMAPGADDIRAGLARCHATVAA